MAEPRLIGYMFSIALLQETHFLVLSMPGALKKCVKSMLSALLAKKWVAQRVLRTYSVQSYTDIISKNMQVHSGFYENELPVLRRIFLTYD